MLRILDQYSTSTPSRLIPLRNTSTTPVPHSKTLLAVGPAEHPVCHQCTKNLLGIRSRWTPFLTHIRSWILGPLPSHLNSYISGTAHHPVPATVLHTILCVSGQSCSSLTYTLQDTISCWTYCSSMYTAMNQAQLAPYTTLHIVPGIRPWWTCFPPVTVYNIRPNIQYNINEYIMYVQIEHCYILRHWKILRTPPHTLLGTTPCRTFSHISCHLNILLGIRPFWTPEYHPIYNSWDCSMRHTAIQSPTYTAWCLAQLATPHTHTIIVWKVLSTQACWTLLHFLNITWLRPVLFWTPHPFVTPHISLVFRSCWTPLAVLTLNFLVSSFLRGYTYKARYQIPLDTIQPHTQCTHCPTEYRIPRCSHIYCYVSVTGG